MLISTHTRMSDCKGKSSWPELVGESGEAAAAKIEKQNPRVDAIVLRDGTPTTTDFRCDRVWVWVDSYGVVIRTPNIG
uniref:glu S.griseus protease inhibitor-like n=1 Tax=Erigeron canadensis TaxID=72917 RepID=UPI001CB98983|nr:glu S.griseus protease inhibitor-like [Erigeron canadensis]